MITKQEDEYFSLLKKGAVIGICYTILLLIATMIIQNLSFIVDIIFTSNPQQSLFVLLFVGISGIIFGLLETSFCQNSQKKFLKFLILGFSFIVIFFATSTFVGLCVTKEKITTILLFCGIISSCMFLLSLIAAIAEKGRGRCGKSTMNIGFLILIASMFLNFPITTIIIIPVFLMIIRRNKKRLNFRRGL
jgi:hypothetical protein